MEVKQAIVRGVPDTYDGCIRAPGAGPIDTGLARAQHARYAAFLEGRGLDLTLLEGDPEYPDCCFVEDTAVVAAGAALLCRSGAPSRRGETAAVGEVLARTCEVTTVTAPGTIDGGDVMRLGKRFYVGRTERTNADGIDQLSAVFVPLGFEVIPVEDLEVLHLKSACTPLGDDAVLACPSDMDTGVFDGVRVVEVPADERYAANCLFVNRGGAGGRWLR